MSRKLTQDEISAAAKAVYKIRSEEGYSAAEEAAEELKGKMVISGNTDDESVRTFSYYTGMSWD